MSPFLGILTVSFMSEQIISPAKVLGEPGCWLSRPETEERLLLGSWVLTVFGLPCKLTLICSVRHGVVVFFLLHKITC